MRCWADAAPEDGDGVVWVTGVHRPADRGCCAALRQAPAVAGAVRPDPGVLGVAFPHHRAGRSDQVERLDRIPPSEKNGVHGLWPRVDARVAMDHDPTVRTRGFVGEAVTIANQLSGVVPLPGQHHRLVHAPPAHRTQTTFTDLDHIRILRQCHDANPVASHTIASPSMLPVTMRLPSGL